MKHLLTAIACFFALSVSAQEALPWNPNANNDNIIGTVDLLAMLNVYGEEYSVQTCFKGDLCEYDSFQQGILVYADSECGTILTRTKAYNPSGYNVMTVRIPWAGYSVGDVLHLIHMFESDGNGEATIYESFIDGAWVEIFTLSSPNYQWTNALTYQGRVIFNGEHWEELN